MKTLITTGTIAQHRKARFNYTILETVEAGIVLTGSEVKSLRAGHASIGESYASFEKGELFLINASILPYAASKGGFVQQHRSTRKIPFDAFDVLDRIIIGDLFHMRESGFCIRRKPVPAGHNTPVTALFHPLRPRVIQVNPPCLLECCFLLHQNSARRQRPFDNQIFDAPADLLLLKQASACLNLFQDRFSFLPLCCFR